MISVVNVVSKSQNYTELREERDTALLLCRALLSALSCFVRTDMTELLCWLSAQLSPGPGLARPLQTHVVSNVTPAPAA